MDISFVKVIEWAQQLGLVGLMILIIVGGAKKIWVWGYQLKAMEEDRDYYRTISMRLLKVTDQMLPPLKDIL